jgi:hypothetical protein
LEGYKLHLQSLQYAPNAAKKILTSLWGKKFEMYVLKKGKGMVRGVIWYINSKDKAAIRHWELVDAGWYSFVNGTARSHNGHTIKVITIAVKNQTAGREVDGLKYKLFFGNQKSYKKKFIAKIKLVHKTSRIDSSAHAMFLDSKK